MTMIDKLTARFRHAELVTAQQRQASLLEMLLASCEPDATDRADAMPPSGTEWLSIKEVAAVLGAAPSSVQQWAKDGRLPAAMLPNRKYRIHRDDLDAFVRGRIQDHEYKLKKTNVPGLFRRERDRRYVVRATGLNQKTGKLTERTRTLPEGASRADALRVLAALREEAKAGAVPKAVATPQPQRVVDYVPVWATQRLANGHWSANGGTAETVGWRFDRYVVPVFGEHLVTKITYADLERWLAWMSSQVSARTTRAVYSNLTCLIRDGRKHFGVPPLPDLPKPPARPKTTTEPLTWDNYAKEHEGALTREQLSLFMEVAREVSPHGWYPLCVLGFGSGARFSELAVVEAHDLNLADEVGVWLCRRHLIAARRESVPGVKWNAHGNVKLLDAETTAMVGRSGRRSTVTS